jgi:UDP-glucuronate decarboxylase
VQALKGEPITVYGQGAQTRSFCYVDDLIEGFVRFMALETPCPGPINLGNPGEFTILALAEQVIALTGSRSRIVFSQLPVDDPERRRPDITLAKEKLNWEPNVQLDEGLKKTIAYFDQLLTQAAATHDSSKVRPSSRRGDGPATGGRRAVLAA